jgi:S-adenosylmethionine:tRNA ribosyltransferase-isomerase
MLAAELDYDLPEACIAQRPPPDRDGGRLLVLGEPLEHRAVKEWSALVPEGALVVLNDTRVMKARVFAQREGTGGKLEVLFLDQHPSEPDIWQVMVKSNRPVRPGDRAQVGDARFEFLERLPQGTRWLRCSGDVPALLRSHGHVPLPPYVRRPDDASDEARYQTVFAKHTGSAAAPTAGLHVTPAMLGELGSRGVRVAHVTLHVGAGTFKPVSTESLDDHPMHTERYLIGQELADEITAARQRGGPVVAVGTTVVRALESAALREGAAFSAGPYATELLIQPGFSFQVVDALLTNFHAPKSTLLALVYAFAGAAATRAAYAASLASGYRFLSYGDAMWIPKRCP